MTDEELIELVQSRAPEELTLAEADALRRRLPESNELRDALAGRLDIERFLASSLGGFEVSVDDILARASAAEDTPGRRVLSLLGLGVCAVLMAFVGWVLWIAATGPRNDLAQVDGAIKPAGPTAASDKATEKAGETAIVANLKPAAGEAAPAQATAAAPGTAAANPQVAVGPNGDKNDLGDEPWTALLAAGQIPDPGPLSLFEPVDGRVPASGEPELRRWLAPIPGEDHHLSQRDYWNARCGQIDGLLKLRAPLKEGTALRFTLYEYNNFKIHFWRGSTGVTLHYYEQQNRTWIAHATTREAGKFRPNRWAMAATDEDRYWRTNPEPAGTFEVRCEGGAIVLSRGDVRVVSAPFDGRPDEICFEGRAVVRQLRLVPAGALRPEPEARPVAFETDKPAELRWLGSLPENASFEKLPDGRVRLLVDQIHEPAWAAFAIPKNAIYEVVLRFDEAPPGGSLYFGDEKGAPLARLAFAKERRTGLTTIGNRMPTDGTWEVDLDPNGYPIAYLAEKPWLRLIYGAGLLKCWASVDGVHWGRACEPFTNLMGSYKTLGLMALPEGPRRAITLSRVMLRELASVDALAPVELRKAAQSFAMPSGMGEFLQSVIEAQPANANPQLWRRACALRCLALGAQAPLGAALLDRLADDALASDLKPVECLRVLDDIALLANTWEDGAAAMRLASRYEQVGELAARAGEPRPYSLVAFSEMTAPIWCRHAFACSPQRLQRDEVVNLAIAGDMRQLLDVTRRISFWRSRRPDEPPTLVEWALIKSVQATPDARPVESARPRADWRHPLLVELNKEGYNTLAEFEAAVSGGSFDDAAQIITSGAGGSFGLLPDSTDPDLVVSLADAVSIAMREHPELERVMQEKYGPLGSLRVRQAIASGDRAALEAATLQFYGSTAAAEAHAALGDAALAAGEAFEALRHYRQARGRAPVGLASHLVATEKLAAALLGRELPGKIGGSVEFGQTTLAPAELDAIINDVRTAHASNAQAPQASPLRPAATPAPATFETAPRARLDNEVGENPQQAPGDYAEMNIDWPARQLAVVANDTRLIVSNRFQLTSYDSATGAQQWRVGGDQAQTHDWPLMPMRPVVAGDRVFARRLPKSGPGLTCVALADGKVLWHSKPDGDRWVVCDPILSGQGLSALTVRKLDQQYELALAQYDPGSGALLGERTLLRLRDNWIMQRTCQTAVVEDCLVAAIGGSVVCCDLEGQVRWARKQPWIPPSIDRAWIAQSQDPPLIVGDRVVLIQPSVYAACCIDLASGRQIWRRALPNVRRLISFDADRVIVLNESGVQALDAKNGATLWFHELDKPLHGVLAAGDQGLLFTSVVRSGDGNKLTPLLTWLDPATGAEKVRSYLSNLKNDRPKLGPFVPAKDHLFVFSAGGDQDANRDLLELKPVGKSLVGGDPLVATRWNDHVDVALRVAAGAIFPRWMLLNAPADQNTGVVADWQGEKNVLCTLARGAETTRFARRVKLPAGAKAKLLMRVAADQGEWKLDVRVGGEKLVEQAIPAGGWKDVSVDLERFAGQTIWLTVGQTDNGSPQPYARWNRLELIE